MQRPFVHAQGSPWTWSSASFVVVITSLVGDVGARADDVRPRIFLSCPGECFDTYLRQSLSYFDVVRNPELADITLVIVRQPAGNGGERFTVTAVRAATTDTAGAPSQSFLAAPGATPDEVRTALLQVLLRTLHTALVGTTHERAFVLSLPTRDGATLGAQDDPFRFWVIAPELGGYAEGSSGYYYASLRPALTVRRITEPSKLRLRGSYERVLNGCRLEDGSRVRGDIHSWECAASTRSPSARAGRSATAVGRGSVFENLDGQIRVGPVVEVNAFPYALNASKQLRFAFQVGVWSNFYREPNRVGLRRETRPDHALSIVTDVNQG